MNLPFEVPTGALSPESPIYIERHHDQVMRQQVTREGSTSIIEGARQMGKSSLIAKALAHARVHQCTVIDCNFQDFDERTLADLDTLLRYLADVIHDRLNPPVFPEEIWKGPLGAKDKLSSFMRDHVLQGARMPVIFVIDEADRIFGRPYQDDFFALLRGWHDRRARDALWNKLNLVLAYSTDPRQAIQDLNQSPFNVGTKIQLDDFSVDELWELNRRYGRPLRRKTDIMQLMGVIAGHPFLAQQAFYALSTRTHPLLTLLSTATADVGPFGDHLHHYRNLLEAEPALRQGMRQVINNGNCPSYGVFLRLRSLGLITGVSHAAARPRCQIYAAYFQRVLS